MAAPENVLDCDEKVEIHFMNRLVCVAIPLSAVLLFSAFAFCGITRQGLLYHDSGTNLLEAKFLNEASSILLAQKPFAYSDQNFWSRIKSETTGVPPHTGKIGFTTILWLTGYIVGFSDYLSAVVTATSSMLALWVVFYIAKKLYDFWTAIYAVVLLTCSTFFLLYARSGLSDPVVTLFFLLGLLVYVHRPPMRVRFYYLTGIFMGLAFSCNQWRCAYMPAFLFLADSVSRIGKKARWFAWIKDSIVFGLGFLTPLACFQLPYSLVRLVVGPLPFADYWTQLIQRSTTLGGLEWFQGPDELARSLARVESPAFTVIVLCGLIAVLTKLLREQKDSDFLLISLSLFPFLYFSCMKWHGETLPRTISSIFPIVAIMAGSWIRSAQKYLEEKIPILKMNQSMVALAIALYLCLSCLPWSVSQGITRSGYPQASEYLRATKKQQFMILGMEPVWRFYLGRVALAPYQRPTSLNDLVAKAKAHNVKHVLVDFSTIYSKYGMEYTKELLQKVKPLAVFPNPVGNSLPHLLDLYGLKAAIPIAIDAPSGFIYVFAINDIAATRK